MWEARTSQHLSTVDSKNEEERKAERARLSAANRLPDDVAVATTGADRLSHCLLVLHARAATTAGSSKVTFCCEIYPSTHQVPNWQPGPSNCIKPTTP